MGKEITEIRLQKIHTKLVNILQGDKLQVMRLWSLPDRNCHLSIYRWTSDFTQSGTLHSERESELHALAGGWQTACGLFCVAWGYSRALSFGVAYGYLHTIEADCIAAIEAIWSAKPKMFILFDCWQKNFSDPWFRDLVKWPLNQLVRTCSRKMLRPYFQVMDNLSQLHYAHVHRCVFY